MKKILLFLSFLVSYLSVTAQNFESFFENNTLRLDYVFAGDSANQEIYLDELIKEPQWAGRKHNLTKLPLLGNGQIIVRDFESDLVIYTTSFSTLFQEWQTTEEASKTRKAFENTFLVPYPKKKVKITTQLSDTHNKVKTSMTHVVDPSDILIRRLGEKNLPERRVIMNNESLEKAIDLAFVAEGYTEAEKELFFKDVQAACDGIFSYEPFTSTKNRFNVIAVFTPSRESGVSHPAKGDWKNTAFGSNFDTFYSSRYLTTLRIKEIHNQLAGTPYENVLIMANTEEYGNGGIYNSYTMIAAHHPTLRPVATHEFGHAFAGLADEYFYDDEYSNQYPSDTEPWEQNITTLKDFDSKWKDMLPKNTPIPTIPSGKAKDKYTKIGVYEGAGYQSKGVYRPFDDCRMRTNEAPAFCAVCQRAISRYIDFLTKE